MYIGNICEMYTNGFVKANHRTPFSEQKIVEHLTAMIPGLRISQDFRLVAKPSYLNRLICRRASIAPSSKNDDHKDDDDATSESATNHDAQNDSSQANSTLIASTLIPKIILEKCDALLRSMQQIGPTNYSSENGGAAEIPSSNIQNPSITESAYVSRSNESETDESIGSDTSTIGGGVPNDSNSTMDSQSNVPQSFSNRWNDIVSQIAEVTDIDDTSPDSSVTLPITLAHSSSQGDPIICDFEKLWNEYEQKLGKNQRIIKAIVMKREKSYQVEVFQLKSKNRKLQINLDKLKAQHNGSLQSMLRDAVEETKRKKWCWNCQAELKHAMPNIPLCKNCVNRQWYQIDL